jgi:glycosyltransferase involved in cell wall biosynthesis
MSVVSLTDRGAMGETMAARGVPVAALGGRRGAVRPSLLWRLVGVLREQAPDIVQTWVYHSNLLGGLAAQAAGRVPVIWNLRRGTLDRARHKRLTRWTARTCASLSRRLPARIVCCSEAAREAHIGMGYAREKMLVIGNGFDLERFQPCPAARAAVRRELGIPDEAFVIGRIARFHSDKDYGTLLLAAARLALLPGVDFVLAGPGVESGNYELAALVRAAGLTKRCHLLGDRPDIPRLTAAFDVATSSSVSEGFPNVVGEAMACGVPCVVTDVGDSRRIVGPTGRVVQAGDAAGLARAWRELLTLDPEQRRQLGWAARQRIEQHFSLPGVVARYQALYEEVAAARCRESVNREP